MFCTFPILCSFVQLSYSVKHLITVDICLLSRQSQFLLGLRMIHCTEKAEFSKVQRNIGFIVLFIQSLFPFPINCILQTVSCALTDLDVLTLNTSCQAKFNFR